MITELTMEDLQTGLPTPDTDIRIVMFYGAECGPCKATMPNYEAVAKFFVEKGTSIKFYKINAWEPVEQATYCTDVFKITGVPHFKAFCRGQQIADKAGGGDEPTMMAFVQQCVDDVFKLFGVRI